METLALLLKQGKIRAAGVCNYNAEQMKTAEQTIKLASNQVPFSMVNRGIEKEVVPYAIEHNKSILAYSPMERGLLTGKLKPGQQFEPGDHRAGLRTYKEENIRHTNAFLEKIKPIADDKGATLGQLVIRWTIDRPGITIALVGARNAEQTKQNAKAIDVKLSADESAFINRQLDELVLVD
jgi:aryl-alcohol dehydrogenase-like predicted oxidoreductase